MFLPLSLLPAAFSTFFAVSPPAGVAPLEPVRTVRAVGEGVTLAVEPCPLDAACSGSVLRLAPGEYTVVVRRPGNLPVRDTVLVAGADLTVDAPATPLPDRVVEKGWASTSVALGLVLVTSAVIILGLDGAEGKDLRVGTPIAAGLGAGFILGGAWSLRWLDGEPERPIDGALTMAPDP